VVGEGSNETVVSAWGDWLLSFIASFRSIAPQVVTLSGNWDYTVVTDVSTDRAVSRQARVLVV